MQKLGFEVKSDM